MTAATAMLGTAGFAYAAEKLVEMPDGTVVTKAEHDAHMTKDGKAMSTDDMINGKADMKADGMEVSESDAELLEESAAPSASSALMKKEGTMEGNLEVMKEQKLNDGSNIPTGTEPNAANETESMLDEDLRNKEGLSEAGDVLETEPSMNEPMLDEDLRVKEGLTQDEPGL